MTMLYLIFMELFAYIQAKNLATLYFKTQSSETDQMQMHKILFNLPEGVVIFDKLKQSLVFKNDEFTNIMHNLFGSEREGVDYLKQKAFKAIAGQNSGDQEQLSLWEIISSNFQNFKSAYYKVTPENRYLA